MFLPGYITCFDRIFNLLSKQCDWPFVQEKVANKTNSFYQNRVNIRFVFGGESWGREGRSEKAEVKSEKRWLLWGGFFRGKSSAKGDPSASSRWTASGLRSGWHARLGAQYRRIKKSCTATLLHTPVPITLQRPLSSWESGHERTWVNANRRISAFWACSR